MANPKTKKKDMIIHDDFSFTSKKDGKVYKLTLKQKLFADYYVSTKGDSIKSLELAGFQFKTRSTAASMAGEYLRKPHILEYVNSMLDKHGFNDEEVYKQHLFLLQQHDDLKVKAKAIEMYYKLKGLNAPEKKDITSNGEKIESIKFEFPGDVQEAQIIDSKK